MDVCRICLSSRPDKDMQQLSIPSKSDDLSYVEIISFCLDIQVTTTGGLVNNTKLCKICFSKIISFYEFKSIAHKNDAYFRNIANRNDPVFLKDLSIDLKDIGSFEFDEVKVKEEVDFKDEDLKLEIHGDEPDYQSDDELLSVIQKIKHESDPPPTQETAPKKRGRPLKERRGPKKRTKEICEECGQDMMNLEEHMHSHHHVLLSVIQKIRDESDPVPTQDTAPKKNKGGRPPKKRRGPKKGFKTKTKEVCEECGQDVMNLEEHMHSHHHVLLSVIQKIRHEFDPVPTQETAPKKNKRGRPPKKRRGPKKGFKTKTKEVCQECGHEVINLEEHMRSHYYEVPIVTQNIKHESNPILTQETAPKKRGRPVKKKRGPKKGLTKTKEICEECGHEVKNLKEHMRSHQPLKERQNIQCKLCDKLFSSYGARYKHTKVKHLNIKHKCDICNKRVVSLKSHILVRHKTEELKYVCPVCDRRFLCQSGMDIHMLTHTKDRPHACDLCDKKFRTKQLMKSHKRQVHELEKSHLCQFCSKSFFKKYHLQLHIRIHTKEKPYACEECGKSFSSTTILNSHKLTHGSEKTHQCPHCSATFLKAGYLKVHLISHTKERRHPCKYCGLKFGRSDHRKRHEYTAHEKHVILPTSIA